MRNISDVKAQPLPFNRRSDLPKLLVIGARGFLGSFVASRASAYDVYRGDRTLGDESDVVIDITEPASVRAAFEFVRPDAVIHLAAISDIDRCQREPVLANAVNVHGVENVANACAAFGARLLFTSTGAVFDGRKHGYVEDDEVNPVSIYGETKVRAERIIREILPTAMIARISLVLGRAGRDGTNSLIDNMLRRWNKGEAVYASTVESRNPIDAATLSQWIIELIAGNDTGGLYHLGATNSLSRFELARNIANSLSISSDLIQPELSRPAGRAPRGADHFLLPNKVSRLLATPPPNCRQVIERSLHEVAQSSIRTGV